jgi:hypothetical protein
MSGLIENTFEIAVDGPGPKKNRNSFGNESGASGNNQARTWLGRSTPARDFASNNQNWPPTALPVKKNFLPEIFAPALSHRLGLQRRFKR